MLSAGDGAGAIGSGAVVVTTNVDVRAASTAVKTVEPRKEECTRTAMRSHGQTSPPPAGLITPRTILSQATLDLPMAAAHCTSTPMPPPPVASGQPWRE